MIYVRYKLYDVYSESSRDGGSIQKVTALYSDIAYISMHDIDYSALYTYTYLRFKQLYINQSLIILTFASCQSALRNP